MSFVDNLRFCEPKTYQFDVDDRFLMGFMGSKNGSEVVELGPIISREIVTSQYSNFKVIGSDNDLMPSGDISTITRTVCNDDPEISRTMEFTFEQMTASKQNNIVKESTNTKWSKTATDSYSMKLESTLEMNVKKSKVTSPATKMSMELAVKVKASFSHSNTKSNSKEKLKS